MVILGFSCIAKKPEVRTLLPGFGLLTSVASLNPDIHKEAKPGAGVEGGDKSPPMEPLYEQVTKQKRKKIRYYRVRRGDTLFLIAKKVYGNGQKWRALFVRNKKSNWRKDPDWLEVGMRIYYR